MSVVQTRLSSSPRRLAMRFCCAAHKTAFWSAARRWAEKAVVSGSLSADDIRNDVGEACTLLPGPGSPAPVPFVSEIWRRTASRGPWRGRRGVRRPLTALPETPGSQALRAGLVAEEAIISAVAGGSTANPMRGLVTMLQSQRRDHLRFARGISDLLNQGWTLIRDRAGNCDRKKCPTFRPMS